MQCVNILVKKRNIIYNDVCAYVGHDEEEHDGRKVRVRYENNGYSFCEDKEKYGIELNANEIWVLGMKIA